MSDPRLRLALRGLVLTTAALAAATAILALLPGAEHTYDTGLERRDAGGGFVAAAALAVALPGVAAWRWPRARLLAAWLVVAVAASLTMFAFLDDVRPRDGDVVLWPLRAITFAAWALAGLATIGALLVGLAAWAARSPPHDPGSMLATRLRRFLAALAAVCAVIALVGLLPGVAVYDDANDCFGRALGSLAVTEHHHDACTASYTTVRETRRAGGAPVIAYALLLLAPAIVLRRAATPARAWAWVAWSLVAAVAAGLLFVELDFHLDLFAHTVTLWPARVVAGGLVVCQVMMLVVLPVTILGAREPRVPIARAITPP